MIVYAPEREAFENVPAVLMPNPTSGVPSMSVKTSVLPSASTLPASCPSIENVPSGAIE